MTDKQNPLAEAGDSAEAGKYTPEQTQAYIKSLRTEAETHRKAAEAAAAKLLERERLEEEEKRKALEEQGKYKTLYEKTAEEAAKHKTAADEGNAYKVAFQASLDSRIQAIPEGMRTLVPEGLDPLALSQWLDKNAALLKPRTAPDLDAGAGGSAGGGRSLEITTTDRDMATAMGIPLETYMKRKAEGLALRGKKQE